jgi:hypothetical protein
MPEAVRHKPYFCQVFCIKYVCSLSHLLASIFTSYEWLTCSLTPGELVRVDLSRTPVSIERLLIARQIHEWHCSPKSRAGVVVVAVRFNYGLRGMWEHCRSTEQRSPGEQITLIGNLDLTCDSTLHTITNSSFSRTIEFKVYLFCSFFPQIHRTQLRHTAPTGATTDDGSGHS